MLGLLKKLFKKSEPAPKVKDLEYEYVDQDFDVGVVKIEYTMDDGNKFISTYYGEVLQNNNYDGFKLLSIGVPQAYKPSVYNLLAVVRAGAIPTHFSIMLLDDEFNPTSATYGIVKHARLVPDSQQSFIKKWSILKVKE